MMVRVKPVKVGENWEYVVKDAGVLGVFVELVRAQIQKSKHREASDIIVIIPDSVPSASEWNVYVDDGIFLYVRPPATFTSTDGGVTNTVGTVSGTLIQAREVRGISFGRGRVTIQTGDEAKRLDGRTTITVILPGGRLIPVSDRH